MPSGVAWYYAGGVMGGRIAGVSTFVLCSVVMVCLRRLCRMLLVRFGVYPVMTCSAVVLLQILPMLVMPGCLSSMLPYPLEVRILLMIWLSILTVVVVLLP